MMEIYVWSQVRPLYTGLVSEGKGIALFPLHLGLVSFFISISATSANTPLSILDTMRHVHCDT